MGELRAVGKGIGRLHGVGRLRRGSPLTGLFDDIPWDVVATDVTPKAFKSVGRGRGAARLAKALARTASERRKKGQHTHKEAAVEFNTFVEEFLKYAGPLPMGSFFSRAAGVLPPALPTAAKRLAARLKVLPPEQAQALRSITTVGETVKPPVWLR